MNLRIDRFGVWVYLVGDEICWLWPWRRDNDPAWYSLSFDWCFESLNGVLMEWEYFAFDEGRFVGRTEEKEDE